MDPVGGSSPAASENEAATQHLKSLLGFFGGGGVSGGGGAGGLLSDLLGGAGGAQQKDNGDESDSLTNGVSMTAPTTGADDAESSFAPLNPAAVSPSNDVVSNSLNGVEQTPPAIDMSGVDEKRRPSTPRNAGNSDATSTPPTNLDSSPRSDKSEGECETGRIELTGGDDGNFYAISGGKVEIVASEEKSGSERTAGSNKVKIKPVVKYDFEHRYYHGEMVAIHHHGSFVAYALKGGKSGGQGFVKVIRLRSQTANERLLLKDFRGRVTDLNFSHSEQALLACADEAGYLYVYEIVGSGGKISSRVVLLVDSSSQSPSNFHRVFWCPYIPEGPDDVEMSDDEGDKSGASLAVLDSRLEDARKLLVVTHDEKAEMWHVDYVGRKYGNKPLRATDVEKGCLKINSHTAPITAATFAPDGTALATASQDGEVKFFQVYLQDNKEPRCLHQWRPHKGRPVSSLLFLDDHQNPNPNNQFWKFAVTGCDNNTEIKLWSCENWSCLQTLEFLPFSSMASSPPPPPEIKVVADLSFRYLVLSDITKKVLYVLAVQQDWAKNAASFVSISEFGLTSPALSFCVYDVSLRPYKRSSVSAAPKGAFDEEPVDGEAAAQSNQVVVVVRMFSIHTKMVQELQIQCVPEAASVTSSRVSSQPSSQDDVVSLHDGLTDVSSVDSAPESPSLQNTSFSNKTVTLKPKAPNDAAPVLMSPDAFTSPASPKRTPRNDPVTSPSLSSIAPPGPSLLPQIASVVGSESTNLSGSGSTLTGVTSLSSTAGDVAHRESNGISNELLQDMFNLTLKAQQESESKLPEQLPESNRSSPSSRSSSTSMEVSEILQGTKTKDEANQIADVGDAALVSGTHVAPAVDVEMEEDEEEPTLRPAGVDASSASSHKNGSNLFENSDVDDEDEDALAADGGDEDEGDEDYEDERAPGAYPRSVPVAPSASAAVSAIAVPCSSSAAAATMPHDDVAAVKAAAAHPSLTHWPKAPLIDVPKEAKIHQGPKPKSDQVVGEIMANSSGVTLFRPPATSVPVLASGFSEASDHDDDDDDEEDDDDDEEEESYSISSTSSSPRNKQSQNPKREKSRKGKIDVNASAPSRIPTAPSRIPAVTSEPFSSQDLDSAPAAFHHPHQGGAVGGSSAISASQQQQQISSSSYSASGGHSFDSLGNTLQVILETLQRQQKDIAELQSRIASQSAGRTGLDELEGNLCQKLDAAVEQLKEVHQERLYAAVNDLASTQAAAAAAAAASKNSSEDQSAAKAQQEALVASVNHTLSSTVASKMERALKDEFKKTLVPAVKTSMEPVKNIVQTELSQKLTTTDHALRESVSKMVRSRQAVEAIGQAAGQALQAPIQSSYQEAFKSHVIPVFEKACNNMFSQINASFQKGTREYMHNMEKELNSLRNKYIDQKDPVVQQLQMMVDSFAKSQPQMLQANQELIQRTIAQQMDAYHTTVQASLRDSIQQIVRQELKESLTHHHAQIAALIPPVDQVALLRSGAATPVPMGGGIEAHDYQAQIKNHLKKRDTLSAFKTALSSSDLAIVTYLCQKIGPKDVFPLNGTTTLTQPVILSLIQQLSANLSDHSDLKLEYLREALMALDDTKQVTIDHLDTLLPILVQNLQLFQAANPENKKTKMVLMLAKGLVK